MHHVLSISHGPCGLVNVKDAKGEHIIKGRKVTGFSNKEEFAVVKEVRVGSQQHLIGA